MSGFDNSSYETSIANPAPAQQLTAFEGPANNRSRAEAQLENQNTPTRVFAPGTEITNGMLENQALSPDQLRLERNLIYRDANPNAFFSDPNLESTINKITGTKGDPVDPANKAANTELSGLNLQNSQKLAMYEATGRISQWRENNPNSMSDASIPARLPNDQINCVSQARVQDAINDFFAQKGFPFSGQASQQLYRQMRDYQPNPRYNEANFTSEDRTYLDSLVARRAAMKATSY